MSGSRAIDALTSSGKCKRGRRASLNLTLTARRGNELSAFSSLADGDDLHSSSLRTFSLLPALPLPYIVRRPFFHSVSLTFFLHLDLEALFEPARLALVPPRHVHDALAALLAHVVQVPASNDEKREMRSVPSFRFGAPSSGASPQSDRDELERKGRRSSQ